MSVNGRIQPHGAPTEYFFEYGSTAAYGQRTPTKQLSPKLAAHYRESWDTGNAGWRGGAGPDLQHHASGGLSGGYVRFAEPSGNDYNHVDGIGLLHLCQYFYIGSFDGDAPTAALGGAQPDLRDAKVRVSVRGTSFRANGSELLWWSQVDVLHGKTPAGREPQFANWAHTGYSLTDALLSGSWETVEYRLWNDTTDWTYAGSNAELNAQLNRNIYVYAPLDSVLSNLDTDIFHILTPIDTSRFPTGSIDFDEIELTYRNQSLLFPSNGGRVLSMPEGSTDPAALTDGWRVGEGKTWTTGPNPQTTQELMFEFESPVSIERIQLQQHPEWPSKEVEIYSSPDGIAWTQIVGDVIPEKHEAGPIFAFLLVKDIVAPPARKLKVRINSGYRAERWGLGEIEVFGTGGVMRTDDDWYRVTVDVPGLTRGQTYHYRLVSVSNGKAEYGGDLEYTAPADSKPEVRTGAAKRIVDGTAKLEGRMNSLGAEANWYFEYGSDPSYGWQTPSMRTGTEITPRTFVATIQGLTQGATVHYRLVAEGAAGKSVGDDRTFVAK
ncbi:MAG: hypothetical protein JST00_28185 [Deltaproteobacteria bacterium]|nr:hypothetical protein [Deltaproteobacteria bacterium]